MYFLNAQRTLCHIMEDLTSGEAPDPCGSKAHRNDLRRYQEGKSSNIFTEKPFNIPLCKHCEKQVRVPPDRPAPVVGDQTINRFLA